ncbi:hypothetical protein G5S52_00010 [Grimontia sp. S25]|uniref:Uncharacterized protein n=1 Tax=Grimontia sedimenti TaxID=2711294 RepID=A0A6M1RIQ7_9GAMM|nr:hypothetical protein [Grimontia sedimenti]NGN96087.1 hypothetical protein [Grimontia sedimenti]
MSQVKLPSNATVLYISGVASLVKGSDKPLAAGEYLKAGDMLDVAEPTLIEFLGEDGGIYFMSAVK